MAKTKPVQKIFDSYPSRIFEKPRLINRLDPVVYRDSETLGLSTEERLFFEQNGFLLLQKFFPQNIIRDIRNTVDEIAQDLMIRKRPEVILESNGEVRSLFSAQKFHKMFEQLAASRRILSRVRGLLGSPVYLHQYRINFKRPFEGREFPWHSDFETWHVEDGMPRMRAVSCMVFLEENNEFNGPLMVIPGSHRVFVSCVGATPEKHYKLSLVKQEYGVPDEQLVSDLIKQYGLQSVKGPPGSLLLFDCNIMHASSGNLSPFGRSNLFMVYNSCENSLLEPFCEQPPRPDFVANRNFSPITA